MPSDHIINSLTVSNIIDVITKYLFLQLDIECNINKTADIINNILAKVKKFGGTAIAIFSFSNLINILTILRKIPLKKMQLLFY